MKLSIITINLNNGSGLVKTLASTFEQTFQDLELIVIDGGSTDNSCDVIETFADKITESVSEQDNGIYHAMNKGLDKARGEYVNFMNSGDWFASKDVLKTIFSTSDYFEDFLYGNSVRRDSNGLWKEIVQPDSLTMAKFFGTGISHQATFYKKELFDTLGGYDESFKIAGDWEFNVRSLMSRCSVRHLSFPVVYYEGDGISVVQSELAEKEKEKILKRYFPEAIYSDYIYLKSIEKENVRLKEFEVWTQNIRNGSLLRNMAMAMKWFAVKVFNSLFEKKRDIPK